MTYFKNQLVAWRLFWVKVYMWHALGYGFFKSISLARVTP